MRGRAAAAAPLKELGDHPDGGKISVMSGRYGPYVKWEKVNATLPRDVEPADLTLEQALELISAKAAKSPKKAAKKPAAKKATAKAADDKPAAKAKKPAAKKAATKTTASKTTGAKSATKTTAAKKPAAKKPAAKKAASDTPADE